jgi:hypothetical protein
LSAGFVQNYPRIVSGGVALIGAFLLALLAGCSNGPGDPTVPSAAATLGGGKAIISVEAGPDDAMISVNGSIKGTTPLSIQIEIDNLGDVAMDYDVVATFTGNILPTGGSGAAASRSTSSEPMTYRLARGDRVPTVIRFSPDDVSAR